MESALVEGELAAISDDWRAARRARGDPSVHAQRQTFRCGIVRAFPGGINTASAATAKGWAPKSYVRGPKAAKPWFQSG